MTTTPTSEALISEWHELDQKIASATSWGAALGVRNERRHAVENELARRGLVRGVDWGHACAAGDHAMTPTPEAPEQRIADAIRGARVTGADDWHSIPLREAEILANALYERTRERDEARAEVERLRGALRRMLTEGGPFAMDEAEMLLAPYPAGPPVQDRRKLSPDDTALFDEALRASTTLVNEGEFVEPAEPPAPPRERRVGNIWHGPFPLPNRRAVDEPAPQGDAPPIDRRPGFDVGAGTVKEGDIVMYQGRPCKVLTVYVTPAPPSDEGEGQ